MLHATIPFVDLRGKTPMDLLRAYPDRARDMMRASRRAWGIWSQAASYVALPVGDRLSRRWLRASRNPYLYEIESFADILGAPGVIALNLSFEWGCTGGVWNHGESVAMLRVLDWRFPGLGKYAVVALQQGRAGVFYNITWPGLSGVYTAMAPGRFSVAIHQAPMRQHGLTFAGDWVKNQIARRHELALPPSHLLRKVCEDAANYKETKAMLQQMPIAMPAIFVLGGVQPAEGCVIERAERRAETRELGAHAQVTAANHFVSSLSKENYGLRPMEFDSAGRYRQSLSIHPHELEAHDFSWLSAPILNAYTRLAVLADAASGQMMAQGFEGALPVTAPFQLVTAASQQNRAVS